MEKFADGIRRSNASISQALHQSTRRNMHQSIDEEEGNVPMDIIESNHFFELSERADEEEFDIDEEDDSKNLK